ncbi:DEAD/DEAH box helicase [Streptomyces californicus]|uniref:DEAD/DEAH box helicase n=1 Tax=Streptomyces californicus TaxID=67351 RepID=UPI00296F89A5|nr:Helicase associated domain protein [Streptomyces californicus]MDW4912551.1 Helicase associated domain protein [Streptomyces californicus]
MNASRTRASSSGSALHLTPYPHQEEALEAVAQAGEEGAERALVVMACGTGKSLVGRETARRRSATSVLVTVPTLALAEQVHRGWAADFPGTLDTLIVCSDSAVGGGGVPVTVDPVQVGAFLSAPEAGRTRLVISTYQSVGRIAEAYASHALPPLDLIILDEAHHTAGALGKPSAIVLDNDRIPAAFRLSLTATSRVHEGADGTADVISMDSETQYGKRIHDLTFGAAIHRNLLADYEVAIVLVSDEDVHALLQKEAASQTGSGDFSTLAAQIALARAMRERELRSVIAFHSRVARSKKFSDTLGAIGTASADVTITSLHMDATTPSSKRAEQLATLSQPTGQARVVLNNVRTLTEGVDVTSVDGICLVDPKSSQTDIVQAVGRALRLHPDHDRPATILLPVYVASGENPQAVLEASAFHHVWRVLATLRDQDERMDAALTAARRRLSSEPTSGDINAHDVLPEKVKIFGSTTADPRFLRALGVHVLENTTEDWYRWFGLLELHVAQHGHAAVPFSTEAGTLGAWAARQRSLRAAGKLAPHREELLSAQSGWTWSIADFKREQGRAELEAFVAAHGHGRVPRGFVSPATGYRLDNFVALARIRYRDKLMDAEEIAYYEALPGWMWHVHEAKFELFLKYLDEFITKHGHARVPQPHKVLGKDGTTFALGHTVSRKRTAYRKGTLPPGQAEVLEQRPEWMWDGHAAAWEASFEVLAKWASQHRDLKVPFDEAVDGVRIYRWLLKQKALIREGKQPAERRRRLEALPGWSSEG